MCSEPRGKLLYLGCHLFLVIWACPLAFEFLELLCFFGFLTTFLAFLIAIFTCPLVWGVILVGIFHERKMFQAQKGIARDLFILECERNNKDGLSSFQAQTTKINKLYPHPV